MQKLFSLVALLGAAVSPSLVFADSLPTRKPGMWEIHVTPLSGGAPPNKSKQCVDETTDANMQDTGLEMIKKLGGTCSKNSIEKTATGFAGETVCQFNGSKLIAKTSLSGDFDTAYTGQVTSRFEPPNPLIPALTFKLSGKYLGPCTDGLVPGDMVLDNGTKVNVKDIALPSIPSGQQKAPQEMNKAHHDILRQLEDMKVKK